MSTLTITQLNKTSSEGGAASYAPTGTQFIWSTANKAIPHNSWAMPLKMRTARSDMPGSTQPIEQILGWNFEPFTLNGLWDDRWLGAEGAMGMMTAFEQMVQEGKMVLLQLSDGENGSVSMYGIVTDFTPTYRRGDYINYSVTVSPHFRTVGFIGEAIATLPKDPREAVLAALDIALDMAASQANVGVPTDMGPLLRAIAPKIVKPVLPMTPPFQASDYGPGVVGGFLDDIFQSIGEALDMVQNNVLDPLTSGSLALLRLSTRVASIQSTLSTMTTQLSSASSTAGLAYETGLGVLEFESWSRAMAANARLMWLENHRFQEDLAKRTDAKAKALYRPFKGESLYSISQRFYHTPHEWRRIMDRNGLTSLTLAGTELLIIPELVQK